LTGLSETLRHTSIEICAIRTPNARIAFGICGSFSRNENRSCGCRRRALPDDRRDGTERLELSGRFIHDRVRQITTDEGIPYRSAAGVSTYADPKKPLGEPVRRPPNAVANKRAAQRFSSDSPASGGLN